MSRARQELLRLLDLAPDCTPADVRKALRRLARRSQFESEKAPGCSARYLEARQLIGRAFPDLSVAWVGPVELDLGLSEELAGGELLDRARKSIRPTAVPEPGPVIEVLLSFEEALEGLTATLSLPVETICARCSGNGCAACGGRGLNVELERVRTTFPPGVREREVIEVEARGRCYRVRAQVEPHRFFERDGDDIRLVVPLTPQEAVEGAELEIPTLAGRVRVKVPAGVRSGQVLRLRGRGVQRKGRAPGDQLLELQLVLPPVVDEEARKAARRLSGFDPRAVWKREPGA